MACAVLFLSLSKMLLKIRPQYILDAAQYAIYAFCFASVSKRGI